MTSHTHLRNWRAQFSQFPGQTLPHLLLHGLERKVEAIRRERQFDILSDLSRIGDHSRQRDELFQTVFRPWSASILKTDVTPMPHFSNELKK